MSDQSAPEATDPDTCRPVQVDGETVRVRGSGELTEEGQEALTALVRVAKSKFVAEAPEQVGVLQNRLRLAHQARRAKEHQLDDIRRALCDAQFMDDDDPYGHADLAGVIRQAGRSVDPGPQEESRTVEPQPPQDSAVNPAADALSAELCRRSDRLGQLMDDDSDSRSSVREQVYGEVLALRGAIGIVLGHQVADGDADIAGIDYYEAWCARQEAS
jgi:hypothetical protein